MRFIPVLFLIFVFLLSSGEVSPTIVYISPDGSHSEQDKINEAFEDADIVYLEAGTHIIDGPVKMPNHKKLTGDPNAVLQVWENSDQWFVKNIGVVYGTGYPVIDVEVCGFSIDGNCDELPSKFANEGKGEHNAGRLIYFKSASGKFGSGISVHDMTLLDAFSDGVSIWYAEDCSVYNNIIHNCQHVGIFVVCGKEVFVKNNEIAGITSDCLRLDNCVNGSVLYNLLFSYSGDHNNGAGKHGENGMQIGDQGQSKGSTQRNMPQHTTNIEVAYNTFIDCGRYSIWLDSAGKAPGTNVYIHDNEFIDTEAVEKDGKPVTIVPKPLSDRSIETTKKIFDNVKKFIEFSEDGYVKQGLITPIKNWENKGRYTEAYIFLAGYDGQIMFDNQTYIPKPASECAIVQYDTENLAPNQKGQKAELKLTDNKDGSLKAELKVKTKWKEKEYKTYSVLGVKIKIPYWEKKSETVYFTKTFSAPQIFPQLGTGLFNVTVKYYNTTYNPYTLVTVQENGNQTQFSELITYVEYKYKGLTAKEFRQIGYIAQNKTGYKSTYFKETNTWKISEETLSHSGRQLRINGPLDLNSLEIVVHTPYTENKVTDISYSEVRESTTTFFEKTKKLFWIILFFAPFIYSIIEEFGIVFGGFRG